MTTKRGRTAIDIETLARAIHEEYVRKKVAEGGRGDPSTVAWDALPEHMKDSSRRQAEDIAAKIARIECEIVPLDDGAPTGFAFTAEEIESLARDEHLRWWQERVDAGWTLAREKDAKRKETPYLVEWDALSEEIRDYDRNAVRVIPAVLARAGLGIVRGGSRVFE